MRVVITDGGRAAAGYKSATLGDCVARSIAIVGGLPYREVYDRLARETGSQRACRGFGFKRQIFDRKSQATSRNRI